MYCLMISNALSCLVGLIIVFIYIVIYSIKEEKYLKLMLITVIMMATMTVAIKSDKTTLFNDFNKTTYEVKDILHGNFDDTYGTKRMFIWKNTVKIVPKYILHGVGIDNFYYAFDGKPLIRKGVAYDKAHNEYLQILITEGIFGLLFYLLFYAIIVIRGIKNNYKNREIYLIIPVIGYLVQAFFNISVIEVAPIFYISLGLCVERRNL